jgi:hypothetical protein
MLERERRRRRRHRMKRNWIREEEAAPGLEEPNGKEEVSNLLGGKPLHLPSKNEAGWIGGTDGEIR